MKYVLYSLFLHILVVAVGFVVVNKKETDIKPVLNRQVSVELISSSQVLNKLKKKAAVKKQKLKARVLKKNTMVEKKFSSDQKREEEKNLLNQKKIERTLMLSYAQELKVFLEQAKHYPRQAIRLKQSGVVTLKVKIGAGGAFKDVRLVEASSFPILDDAAVNLLKKLGRFKPLPKNISPDSNFTIPISYMIGRRI